MNGPAIHHFTLSHHSSILKEPFVAGLAIVLPGNMNTSHRQTASIGLERIMHLAAQVLDANDDESFDMYAHEILIARTTRHRPTAAAPP